jgi:hypothetical protein
MTSSCWEGEDVNDIHENATTSEGLAVQRVQDNEIVISVEQLPATVNYDERSLVEITDHAVIARISEAVPAAAEVVARTLTNKAIKSVELYKAIIPSGTTLLNSKQMEGAARGMYSGAKGIRGHANLVKVDPTRMSKVSRVATGVSNVISVGSLVVGQYYMSVINAKLESMSKGINKVSDFQDREFKSRTLSLLYRVGEISQFSSDILENDGVRTVKLNALEDLKGVATELLGNVNIAISDIAKKNTNPNLQEYQRIVNDFCVLDEYQKILLSVLEEICNLTYLLWKGEISSDMSYSLFNKLLEQSTQTRNVLKQWHNKQAKALGIDLSKNRISKSKVEDIIFSEIPALINDKWKNRWNFNELKPALKRKINAQTKTALTASRKPEELYDGDVEIVIKDGKYYYLRDK